MYDTSAVVKGNGLMNTMGIAYKSAQQQDQ